MEEWISYDSSTVELFSIPLSLLKHTFSVTNEKCVESKMSATKAIGDESFAVKI